MKFLKQRRENANQRSYVDGFSWAMSSYFLDEIPIEKIIQQFYERPLRYYIFCSETMPHYDKGALRAINDISKLKKEARLAKEFVQLKERVLEIDVEEP